MEQEDNQAQALEAVPSSKALIRLKGWRICRWELNSSRRGYRLEASGLDVPRRISFPEIWKSVILWILLTEVE